MIVGEEMLKTGQCVEGTIKQIDEQIENNHFSFPCIKIDNTINQVGNE